MSETDFPPASARQTGADSELRLSVIMGLTHAGSIHPLPNGKFGDGLDGCFPVFWASKGPHCGPLRLRAPKSALDSVVASVSLRDWLRMCVKLGRSRPEWAQ